MQREAPLDSRRRAPPLEAHCWKMRYVEHIGAEYEAAPIRVVHLQACDLNRHINITAGPIEPNAASKLLERSVYRHDSKCVGRVGDCGVRGREGKVPCGRLRRRKANDADRSHAQRRTKPSFTFVQPNTGLGRRQSNP